MNRRQFTASLAALVAAPAVPLAARVPAAAAPVVPAGAYAWAELIARAQMQCSPEMLARSLHLSPAVARTLFKDMVVDGVLRAPASTGMAQAARPFDTTGLQSRTVGKIRTKAKDMLRDALNSEEHRDERTPLVNPSDEGLGCPDPTPEDADHASTDQSSEEIPRDG